jgi:carbon storage regulator
MLVLSRKLGEQIVIPDRGVVLTVLALRGNEVRLGISAPSDVDVYRGELWLRLNPSGRAEASPCNKSDL